MDILSDLKLTATSLHGQLVRARDANPVVVRLTTDRNGSAGKNRALLIQGDDLELPPGFDAYVAYAGCERHISRGDDNLPVYELPPKLSYLEDGDIIRIDPRSAEAWVMYRRSSPFNSLLLTERCNSRCIMCSQPPKPEPDFELAQACLDAIPLMDPATEELGITGGEPTLLGDTLLDLVKLCKQVLPTTALHILSNGRMLNYLSYASNLAHVGHPDLVIGIPLYSDLAWQHDFIVQAEGAFDQTIRGILNLARCGVRVEIRVVVHAHSAGRLPRLAAFIARNLPFAEHIALMGLEPIGFGRTNLDFLWVDPAEYQEHLEKAVLELVANEMNVSIYNHQLCILPRGLWPYARHSISDWKNVYLPVCGQCAVRPVCGGFFHSSVVRHSTRIRPFETVPNDFGT